MEPEGIKPSIFYGKRYKCLGAAIDVIGSNKKSADVVVLPPDPEYVTDEEDFDDDNIQANEFPNDVAGEVEIRFDEQEEYESDDNIPLSVLRNVNNRNVDEPTCKKQRIVENDPIWTVDKTDISMQETNIYIQRQNFVKNDIAGLNPVEVFEKFFDKNIIDYICEQSELYARQKNNHNFSVNNEDMKTFFGILLFSGYHQLSRERLYWSLDEDVTTPIVTNCMSRNRYIEIKKYLHFADNCNIDKDDKMFKLRPLTDKLNENFLQWGVFHQKLSIDEAMVKYFGHHSSKQFIKGKPIRFGFKDWMICSSNGYCYRFETYCGAKKRDNLVAQEHLPLGSQVVLDLVQIITDPTDHIIFFDNYFTSHALLKTLRERNIRATGTIRTNRTKRCPFQAIKEMNKKDRGYFDYKYDKKNHILIAQWKDNNIVTVATNYDNIEPIANVKRWSKVRVEKIDVNQPRLIANYNKGMGGVDQLDQTVNNYRVSMRGKKWWWPLFTHALNVAVINAWRLFLMANANDDKMDLLSFIREISRYYLRIYGKSTFSKNRPTGSVPKSILKNEGGHFPKKLKNQLRCKHCHMRSRWSCTKCAVTLCIERNCCINYHS